MVDIIEHSFIVSDLVPYPANLKIISAKELITVPGVITKGDIYDLEGITINYERLNENNYSWQKANLIWEENYSGEEITVSWINYNHGFQSFESPQINFPFAFPFYNFEHDYCYFFGDGSILFENKNGLPPPEGVAQLYDLEGMKHYLPRILGIGNLITLSETGKVHIKNTSDFVLITYISDDILENPNVKLELQYKLWSNGNIRVSIKTLCHPQMTRNAIGLLAGISEELFLVDFYGQENGQTNNPYPSGQIQFFRMPNLSFHNFARFIQERYPNAIYDGIFILTDFNLQYNNSNLIAISKILYNDILGTGYPFVDTVLDNFDSSRLRCIIGLPLIDTVHIDPEILFHPITTFHNFAAHEWGHKWIQHLPFWNEGLGHWANSINTVTPLATITNPYHSTLGGSALLFPTKDTEGRIRMVTSSNSPYGYSRVGLYMMGLMSKEEASHISEVNGGLKTIEDIIQALGEERQPTYEFSKKTFNAMIIYLTNKDLDDEIQNSDKIESTVQYFRRFAQYFRDVTLEVGRIMYTDWLPWEPTNTITKNGAMKSFLKDTKEKINFLINYHVSLKDREKSKEFYKLMIDILRFDPCKIDDCEENPIKWPRERWFNQLKQLDKKILKKIDKKVNEFLPNKELKLAIDNYQKISKEKPVQKDSILIGDNDVQARAINF